MRITLGATPAELLPGRALFLPKSRTLVVADLHLGKSATFRRRGLAVPEGSSASDLARLHEIVTARETGRLVIAGDLFHSADGLSSSVVAQFQGWLAELPCEVVLTEGNHDARAWFRGHRFEIEVTPQLETDGLVIAHDPADLPKDAAGIAGHLHPGVRIRESGRSSIRMAGFLVKATRHLVLPAFSEFTGIQPMKLDEEDHFYAEINGTVTAIPNELIRA